MSDANPDCSTCYEAMSTCVHRELYLLAEAYIRKSVLIFYVTRPDIWLAGRSQVYDGVAEITIWSDAYQMYGWDMMTSVLIHEFGHCELVKAENLGGGTIEAEHKANGYGYRNMPSHLIPTRYWDYRKFFLRSYETLGNWTEQTCRQEFKEWLSSQRRSSSAPHQK